ncbi:Ger(x)C family spore germination protein [Paenibacillus sp. R14(2021)]|uniref:Ger(x)C family spore germination protein n=1 Tax=Paenibacillus sp. R14(2021) TaxID=2859228 RepID=UPI001C6113F6|nr:Ger(x)C family spore germination protein [Paenibacillus sp. R14(2021)]
MLKCIAALTALVLLSGCWDNKDINHRALPVAMGISYKHGNYTVYLDIPRVSEHDNGIQIIAATGESISEVIDHISMNMESQVDLLHLKVIVVDRTFASFGLNEAVESLIRSGHIAPKTTFVISDEPLDRFFERLDATSKNDGTALYDYFQKDAGWSPEIAYTQLWKIFRSIHSYTNDVAIPLIKSGDTTILQSTGSAIMKNGKMVSKLNNEQTLLYNVFNGLSTQGKIEVTGHGTIQIVSSRIRNRGYFIGEQPHLKSTIYLKVILLDTRGNPSTDVIKSELKTIVLQRFKQMFTTIQRSKADVFGLGQYFRNDLTRAELANWRSDYLPRIQIDLEVKTVVRNTGNLKTRT